MEKVTAYVYVEEAGGNNCLIVLNGSRKAVESRATEIYEQLGYPASFAQTGINWVKFAKVEELV